MVLEYRKASCFSLISLWGVSDFSFSLESQGRMRVCSTHGGVDFCTFATM